MEEVWKDVSGAKNPFYGKKHSKESIEKMRKASQGKYNGNQEKPVLIEGVEYKSVNRAAKRLKVVPATILHRIKSENKKFINYNYL